MFRNSSRSIANRGHLATLLDLLVARSVARTIADNAPLFTNSHVWQNCADTIAEAAVEAATRARQEHVYAACRFVPRVVVETGRKGADDDGDGFEEGKWGTEENAVIPSENNIKGRILLTQSVCSVLCHLQTGDNL